MGALIAWTDPKARDHYVGLLPERAHLFGSWHPAEPPRVRFAWAAWHVGIPPAPGPNYVRWPRFVHRIAALTPSTTTQLVMSVTLCPPWDACGGEPDPWESPRPHRPMRIIDHTWQDVSAYEKDRSGWAALGGGHPYVRSIQHDVRLCLPIPVEDLGGLPAPDTTTAAEHAVAALAYCQRIAQIIDRETAPAIARLRGQA